jgi:8-oxo-dGTP pyrophosphatase MutT (NUDIX family)
MRVVSGFEPGDDGLAAKSKDLLQMLLRHGVKPLSARQYWPGHITCTALIFHPSEIRVLVIHHHRLQRWLLPGGHVEKRDTSLHGVAAREAREETRVQLDTSYAPFLAGIDVHGIPPKLREPFHLHHDLIWCFRASSDRYEVTTEALDIQWAREEDWEGLDLSPSIRQSIHRAALARQK